MTDVIRQVIADLEKVRRNTGDANGAPPLAGDGTDALQVAYDAVLQLVVALRQLLAERDDPAPWVRP